MADKVKRALDRTGQHIGWNFICPGCGNLHHIRTAPNFSVCWSFNGNVEAPTFAPSVKCCHGDDGREICHFFVTDGVLKFCVDSTHALAGQNVPMNDIDLSNPYLRDPEPNPEP